MTRQPGKKREFTPHEIRTVLRFLRDNPWSSRGEIARGCGMDPRTVQAMIRRELNLRTARRPTADGIPTLTVFNLATECSVETV
jgi:hypothetical protein